MNEVIEVIGETTAPEGAEPFQVRVVDNRREPIEVVGGCIDFKLSAVEAVELGELLIRAGRTMGCRCEEVRNAQS